MNGGRETMKKRASRARWQGVEQDQNAHLSHRSYLFLHLHNVTNVLTLPLKLTQKTNKSHNSVGLNGPPVSCAAQTHHQPNNLYHPHYRDLLALRLNMPQADPGAVLQKI